MAVKNIPSLIESIGEVGQWRFEHWACLLMDQMHSK
jgi:hypothetical protein